MAEIPDDWFQGKCLAAGEVAEFFSVDRSAVTRWAKQGIIGFFRAPNGDRRFPECEVRRLVRGEPPPDFLKELADADSKKFQEKWKSGWRQNHHTRGAYERAKAAGQDEDE